MQKLIIITNNNKNSALIKKKVYTKIPNFQVLFATFNNIPMYSNATYLILKTIGKIHVNVLKKLKKRHNKIIYEVLDAFYKYHSFEKYMQKINKFCVNVHTVICNSSFHADFLKKHNNKAKIKYAYHNADPRTMLCKKRSDDVYYIGSSSKFSLTSKQIEMYNIKVYTPFKKNKIENMTAGIHIDFVLFDKPIHYTIHTTTKLATAFNTRSIFICNRQPIYTELLGEDYFLYINDNLSNIEEIIAQAKAIYNSELLLNEYFEKYKHVVEKLSIDACVQMYTSILTNTS